MDSMEKSIAGFQRYHLTITITFLKKEHDKVQKQYNSFALHSGRNSNRSVSIFLQQLLLTIVSFLSRKLPQ